MQMSIKVAFATLLALPAIQAAIVQPRYVSDAGSMDTLAPRDAFENMEAREINDYASDLIARDIRPRSVDEVVHIILEARDACKDCMTKWILNNPKMGGLIPGNPADAKKACQKSGKCPKPAKKEKK